MRVGVPPSDYTWVFGGFFLRLIFLTERMTHRSEATLSNAAWRNKGYSVTKALLCLCLMLMLNASVSTGEGTGGRGKKRVDETDNAM